VNRALNDCYGNPSSGHSAGRAAAALLKASREKLAAALGAKPDEIYFTSGGTEADNWAVICGAKYNSRVGKHVLTTAVEHDAVMKAMKQLESAGYEVEYLKPDSDGNIPAERFEAAIREDTALVSVMMVNNETGCVFPIEAIARAIKAKRSRALLHTDAVQGFLKLPFKAKSLGADLVSLSSHKIHGPKGCGALYIKKGLHLPPYIFGGGQENGYRSGTEAMPAIAGFSAAAEEGAASLSADAEYMLGLKKTLREQLSEELPDIVFIGDGAAPHILSVSLPGYRSEVIMNYLDAKGICVSKGSACKKGKRSHVLEAMGLPNAVMDGSIRISLSQYNTAGELREFVKALKSAKEELYPSL
jgi:cysteine desulfurase